MKRVSKPMRTLFVTDRPYLPQTTGRSQQSTHELCTWFTRDSNTVAILAALRLADLTWF